MQELLVLVAEQNKTVTGLDLLGQTTPSHTSISPGLDAGLFFVGEKKEGYYGKFNFL